MFTVLPVWLDGEIMVGSPVQAPSQSLTLDEAPNTNGSASGVLGDDTSFGELE
ncbi:MAG: hypothetical protein LBN24_08720 [Mediterranea sp.]|nr:hypothetical protein [Mediterranea sp.]